MPNKIMLKSFLITGLKLLYQNPDSIFLKEMLSVKRHRWSGDKMELVEFAYEIFYTR
jgi:hypothetical protein